MARSLLVLLCLSPACSWVTPADFEARLSEVDDDGDGVPAALDCDDHDATISPSVAELWYDGIDQRCDGGDDYDQDGDGFVADEHEGAQTAGVEGSGFLEPGDCNDEEALVSPIQPDAYYDGADRNCDGLDDFDQDQDGFVDDAYVGVETLYAPGTGQLPGGDCDDVMASVRPGAADAWYDAVDTDCAGNDDFDQDGDLYIPDAEYRDYRATEYVNNSGNLPNGDCDDLDPLRHPAADDAWYDGVDSDCRDDDDYDQDLDGFQSDAYDGADCDDVDSEIQPGGTETLGDSSDSDCNGGIDSFDLSGITGFTWTDAHDPVFDASSDRVYLSIAAQQVYTGSVTYYDSAVALMWLAADVGDGRDGVVAWNSNTTDPPGSSLTGGQAFVATDDYLYGAVGIDSGSDRSLRLVRYDVTRGSRASVNAEGTGYWAPFEDISLAIDTSGALNLVGCESSSGVLSYVKVSSIGTGVPDTNSETSGTSVDRCAMDLRGGQSHVYTVDSSLLKDYTFDPSAEEPGFTAVTLSSFYDPLDLAVLDDAGSRMLVMADDVSGAIILLDAAMQETTVAGGLHPIAVSASQGADGTLYFGFVDDAFDAWLAYGTVAAGFAYVQLGVAFAADDVAVHAADGYVMFAVVGGNNVAVDVARL